MAEGPGVAEEPSARRRLRDPAAWATAVTGLVVFAAAIVMYRATMLPGVGTWDTAEAQTVAPLLGTMHPTGFPAYVISGFIANILLAPFGEPAFRITLFSGLLAAGASGLAVVVFVRLGAPTLLAGACGLAFALAPVTWYIGVSADAHSLHLLLVVAVTLGLVTWEQAVRASRLAPSDAGLRSRADRRIVVTAVIFGVAVANHALSLLLVPCIVLFVLAVEPGVLSRPRLIAAALGASAGTAALLYLQLPLRAGPFRAPLVYGHPETLSGFLEIVFARQFQGDFIGRDAGTMVLGFLELAREQLGPLVYVVPAAFLVTAIRHPRYALYSGLAVLVTCVFAATYANARIDRYYLGPLFFAWTWVAAAGGAVVDRIVGTGSAGEGAPDVTGAGPLWRMDTTRTGIALALGVALLIPTQVALRDRWIDLDHSRNTLPSEWLDAAFGALAPDAVVVSWWSYSTPMWYGQLVEGRRPDVWIVDDRTRIDEGLGEVEDVIEANLGRRPVYLIRLTDAEVDALRGRYVIEPAGIPGNLFRVTGRQDPSP